MVALISRVYERLPSTRIQRLEAQAHHASGIAQPQGVADDAALRGLAQRGDKARLLLPIRARAGVARQAQRLERVAIDALLEAPGERVAAAVALDAVAVGEQLDEGLAPDRRNMGVPYAPLA